MNTQMKFRDLLAFPFWAISLLLDLIAVHVGGVYTADLMAIKFKVKE